MPTPPAPDFPPLETGRPWPLGATVDDGGVNFAVFSAHADAVELCLFDAAGERELARLPLAARSGDVWHGRLPGAGPGCVYGLRAHGRWQPSDGWRFNANKLLLDPYARDIVGDFRWRDEQFGHNRASPGQLDLRDNAAWALKARLVDDARPSGDGSAECDRSPDTPLADTVICELHVKGFSKLNPRVPEALRGSYAGLGHAESTAYLRRLGVTAVCLLPVQQRLDEERLIGLQLTNYWGYNTIGFFCADPRLAAGADGLSPRDEFRAMVRALHAAGIEVLLDVVYNHTAESDETGPTVSFRGLDNAGYYRLVDGSRAHYENHAGCGNVLDFRQPAVRRLALDSLRYWVGEMGVDGFRFDLAPVLGRGDHGFDRDGPFFTAIAQDPLLSRVKLIAEPWDIGPGGYRVGGFARGWLEWNDQFRDAMRTFWLQPPGRELPRGTRGDFARRLCASSDLFQKDRRQPAESINYTVSHDGFTLRDLVSYAQRHNEANGEHNRDGHGHNLSTNCGVEGATDDAGVNARRAALQRAMLATTLLSQGTPMLAAGDEMGHSQHGNNNPYCQDNALTWIDWSRTDPDLIAFTAAVIGIRRRLLPFGNHWYSGGVDLLGLHDVSWLQPDGTPLAGHHWQDAQSRALGCLIESSRTADIGSPVVGVLEAVLVERGDKVSKGQVVAILRADVERAQVGLAQSRARAEADTRAAFKANEFAQKKRERMEDLFNKEFVSSQALDQAVAEAQVADARLRQAREQTRHSHKELQLADAQLELRTIRSPIDGIVTERFRDTGERVEERPILKVATIDPLRVEVVLPAVLYGRVQAGLPATIQPDLAALAPVAGKVSLVDRVIDPASNTFRARLDLPNPDGKVPAGLRCKLQLPDDVTAGLNLARPQTAGMSMKLSAPAPAARPLPVAQR